MGSCFVLTFYVVFVTGFSFCCFGCALFSKINLFGLGLFFDFLVFYSFFFRHIDSLKKNKLSSSLSCFDPVWAPWVFFLRHAVSLWFMLFSKLRCLV